MAVERLWRVATFSCVEVLAYCFMSNHFHILVYVPDPRELSDDELLESSLTSISLPPEQPDCHKQRQHRRGNVLQRRDNCQVTAPG